MERLAYSGGVLDRAYGRRTDAAWLAARLSDPRSRLIPLWRGACLVAGDNPQEPLSLLVEQAAELLVRAPRPVLLGLEAGSALFALDLSDLEQDHATELVGAAAVVDLRRLVGSLPSERSATLAYARGLLHWHRTHRFCGSCGRETEIREAGHLRVCSAPSCGRLTFPRIEPAVIVLVEAGEPPRRCLLARHAGSGPDAWSTLAGFVEIGESLEDAVRREVREEAGVEVAAVRYRGSQAWPFPAGLMLGFSARAAGERIEVDRSELEEARWFGVEEVRERFAAGRFSADSIESALVVRWLAEPGGAPRRAGWAAHGPPRHRS